METCTQFGSFCQPGPRTTRPGVAPVCSPSAQHLDAVDEDVAHAGGILVRLVEGGAVGDRRRIEDREVGKIARRAARRGRAMPRLAAGSEVSRRTASCERDQPLVAHIVAEQAGEIAVGARMRGGR